MGINCTVANGPERTGGFREVNCGKPGRRFELGQERVCELTFALGKFSQRHIQPEQ